MEVELPAHMNTAAHAGSPTQLVMNPVAKQDDRKADEFAYDRPRTEEPNLCCPNIQSSCLACLFPIHNLGGCYVLQENKAVLVQHWGKVTTVLKEPGIYCINVFGRQLTYRSLRHRVLDTPGLGVKCLDCKSNPILVGGAIYYKVEGVQASVLAVQDLKKYIISQFEVVLKQVCSRYPYEADEENPSCLKSESHRIGRELCELMQERLNFCGVRVLSAALTDLSYAPEIAQPMLMRQQAEAMVKARELIVQGAVLMTEGAVRDMEEKGHTFSDEEKALLIRNMLSMICGRDKGTG
ncbi:PHB domain-containing protein [Chloropicon roscoffensis]|uniref:PHB domain-containing protein n=1 Tax=Chloropicon roscoffensis TaxID=1461544 RepID=A0AAX4PKI3_9CHLO